MPKDLENEEARVQLFIEELNELQKKYKLHITFSNGEKMTVASQEEVTMRFILDDFIRKVYASLAKNI